MHPALKMGDVAGGGVISPGANATVFVGGSLWSVMAAPVAPHSVPYSCQASPVMVTLTGPHTVLVQGVLGLHLGDLSSCGCPGTPGVPTVMADG